MQLHLNFVSLLAVLHVLSPAVPVAIPRFPQASLSLGGPTAPRGQLLDTRASDVRFYRRKAALCEDWEWPTHVNGRLPDAAYIPKTKRTMTTPFVLGSISTEGGDRGIFIGKHGRRAFPRMVPLGPRTRWRSSLSDATTFGVQGIAGTIDIMSPTVDSPVGEKIASLSVSMEPSGENQFVLNASGANASIVYLVVKNEPMQDGTLAVALQVPVFDREKAEYVAYCATFATTQASPLTAVECINSDQDVTDRSSQVFSYNSTSGVIKPLWLTSSPLPGTDSPAVTKEEDAPSDGDDLPEESDTVDAHASSSNSTGSTPHSVSLVFTPEVDASTPIVHSQASHDMAGSSNASDMPSATANTSHVTASVAMNSAASSHTPLAATATAEEVSAGTVVQTMCHGSVASTLFASAAAAEAPPMLQEPTSSTVEQSSTSSMTEKPTPTAEEEMFMSSITSTGDSASPTNAAPDVRRRKVDTGVDEEDSGQNMSDDEEENTQGDETSELVASNDDAKRAVDTAYAWKFSSSQAMNIDNEYVR